jgi:uncharacterized membrane protein YwaF
MVVLGDLTLQTLDTKLDRTRFFSTAQTGPQAAKYRLVILENFIQVFCVIQVDCGCGSQTIILLLLFLNSGRDAFRFILESHLFDERLPYHICGALFCSDPIILDSHLFLSRELVLRQRASGWRRT